MKTKILPALALLTCFVFSCSDDETPYKCSTCVDAPEALAANDNSGKGIYKGLVVGSTGTIKFNIANSGATIDAVLILDGTTIPLQTEGTYSNGFEGYFFNTAKGVEIGFYVSSNGSFEIFYIEIAGHPDASIEIVKELSTALVAVYEGTFRGDVSGTFNMLTRGSIWAVVAKATGDEGSSSFYGSLSDGSLQCVECGDVDITGKITGDNVSGEWETIDGDSGSWKGKRTL